MTTVEGMSCINSGTSDWSFMFTTELVDDADVESVRLKPIQIIQIGICTSDYLSSLTQPLKIFVSS